MQVSDYSFYTGEFSSGKKIIGFGPIDREQGRAGGQKENGNRGCLQLGIAGIAVVAIGELLQKHHDQFLKEQWFFLKKM